MNTVSEKDERPCTIAGVGNWPFYFNRGQRVKVIIDQFNEGNMRVANVGDIGTLLVDCVDADGKVRVKLDRKHYPLSISQTAMMPV